MVQQTDNSLVSRYTRNQTLVIAEAGVNHNGSLELAKKLIDAAADAGADFVKFQTFKAGNLITVTAEKASYQKDRTGAEETQLQMLEKLELTEQMHLELMDYCRSKGIRFLSTPFDLESLLLLQKLDLPLIKIPSGEITNLPLLQKAGALQKDVLLSTGMATLAEVEAAVEVLEKTGTLRENICVLHCTTAYPAPVHEANLLALTTIKDALQVEVGYSDHTLGIEAALAAVALGARVIEKHFTIDKNLPGPDHKASLDTEELKALVAAIRKVEQAMGNEVKQPTESEQQNMVAARKSIYTSRAVQKGEIFTEENLAMKRPGNGISPMQLSRVLGRKATHTLAPEHLLTFKDLEA